MGYMRFNSIIVTCDDRKLLDKAHKKAFDLFKGITGVSNLAFSSCNDYASFMVAPDGLKMGWAEAIKGEKAREKFRKFLKAQSLDDNSTLLKWVEVQYADDDLESKVTDSCDNYKKYGDYSPEV